MRVLHTSQYYWPFIGGAEKYCQAISEGLGNAGLDVSVFSTDVISVNPTVISADIDGIRNGVKLTRLESLPILNGIYGKKSLTAESDYSTIGLKTLYLSDRTQTWHYALVARALSSSVPQHFAEIVGELKNCDLAGLFNIITGMTAISYLSARIAKRPIIIFPFFHFNLLSYERQSLMGMLRGASAVICSTGFEQAEIVKRGVDHEKTYVVYEGIRDPRSAIDYDSTQRFQQQIGLKEDDFVISYIGRRDFDKGFQHVLAATAGLVRLGLKVRLIVSGYGDTGSYLNDYNYLISQHALIDVGVADEKTKLKIISMSKIVVLPSRAETFPLIFSESWFLGKPVIGANIGSVASVVRNGIDGFLVEFGDVESLMRAIRSIYENPDLSVRMGEAGKEKAQAELRLEDSVSKIKSIYESVTKRL